MESFNGKLRDELLNRELFLSLEEARYVLDAWRLDYNHRCPSTSTFIVELVDPGGVLREFSRHIDRGVSGRVAC